MKKTISIIATGGTIASKGLETGIKPNYKLEEMLKDVSDIFKIANIRAIQLMNKDSTNIYPSDWVKIATSIYNELKFSDGVVVTHGTDTMAYTASMTSFMIQNLNKPVIFTGSQRSWDEKGTDARTNLMDAVRVAIGDNDINIKGVHIVFNTKIIKGCRARKSKHLEKTDLDAFETVNYPLVGLIKDGHIMVNPLIQLENEKEEKKMRLDTKISEGVIMVMLTPGFDPNILEAIKDMCKGIIIQAYGLGDMPIKGRGRLIPIIKDYIENGKVVCVTSQACYQTDLSRYEVGKEFLKLGVIPTLDMTQESAYAKLMWILGHTNNIAKIKELMWKNFSGEIWPVTNGYKKDIIGEMAKYHELTRMLYESNTELMNVIRDIFEKIANNKK